MKELLRNYYLSKLIDAPLNKELVLLENATIFIEDILKKATIKVDEDKWVDYEFYFRRQMFFLNTIRKIHTYITDITIFIQL